MSLFTTGFIFKAEHEAQKERGMTLGFMPACFYFIDYLGIWLSRYMAHVQRVTYQRHPIPRIPPLES